MKCFLTVWHLQEERITKTLKTAGFGKFTILKYVGVLLGSDTTILNHFSGHHTCLGLIHLTFLGTLIVLVKGVYCNINLSWFSCTLRVMNFQCH